MSRPTKRAQVEALGWTFTATPRHWRAGALWHCERTGRQSPASLDYRHPEAWTATPPPSHPGKPRRFETSSPNPAVCWAWEQAMAPQPSPELTGVAALMALAAAAGASGVVAEGGDAPAVIPALPDGELLHLCREIAGAERIAEAARKNGFCPWNQRDAHKTAMAQMSEACRSKDRLIPRVLELPATTVAGALAKAQVVLGLFDGSSGRRSRAVSSLVADLDKVLNGTVAGAGDGTGHSVRGAP